MKSKEETSKPINSGNRPSSLKPEGDWTRIFPYHAMDVEITRAEGIYYYDTDDNRYIDASGVPFSFNQKEVDDLVGRLDNTLHEWEAEMGVG